ncbi:uncharacterized protein LOC110835959 [Zootermopsis nevadensis]|uniref:uncharacterized protein LOC110835959 n=1 Tax=Zootermopsis nevadensis TaxID=136037 RepID=UPI000B8EB054|nr:uncharacterized protein LOC110835959 [Zootermopsis nevadensis]
MGSRIKNGSCFGADLKSPAIQATGTFTTTTPAQGAVLGGEEEPCLMARSGLSPLSKVFGVGGIETLMRQQGRRAVCVCPPERTTRGESLKASTSVRICESLNNSGLT